MKQKSKASVIISFLLLITFIVGGSLLSVQLWGEKKEKVVLPEIKIVEGMTISEQKAAEKINSTLAYKAEEASKNWVKIPIKIVSWLIFLFIVYRLLRKNKISPKTRKYLLFSALTIFGIILGTEPNPMATLTDNIFTLITKGYVFPPRIIMLSVFLIILFFANKLVCAWACQIGTLQDLIFRLNRNTEDTKGIFKQYKVPFAFTNTVRIAFFVTFIAGAFIYATNIIGSINIFALYSPASLEIGAIVFIAGILIASLFIYRPWCHFFCPFGLVGWFMEKISRTKINVNHNSCISCEACSKACPTNVMGAILKQEKTIPDCFSCGTCMNVCPTNSIKFEGKLSHDKPSEKNVNA